ncbi:hypothetical protein Sru01_33730 [Sphaerisporangium rufum]|uniref:Uncharacterized protein n=1 Tax=Sphaerisporangium rufum TaxID=1381558 RepID=A0A919R4T0_9ACTN|nr:hypothetical protein Sru01_33730 [Sphaerisporangium rufum]
MIRPSPGPDPGTRHQAARPGRVFMVCTELPPDVVGGLGRYAERMIAAMRAAGTPVLVLAATGRRGSVDTIGDVTVRRIRTPGVRAARVPRPVGQLLRLAGLLAFNVVAAARIWPPAADRPAAWSPCTTGWPARPDCCAGCSAGGRWCSTCTAPR